MGLFLVILGFVVNGIAGVVILIRAFKVSVGWGLAVMFLPFAALFFVIKNWEDTKTPFLVGIGGGVLMFLGMFMTAANLPDENPTVAETPRASQSESEPEPSYAAAAVTPTSYEPPRNTYAPSSDYTPSYTPPPAPATTPVAVVTETQAPEPEDEWQRKPKYEQVYVDRDTNLFYGEKCKKRPENVYRVPKTIAVAQGLTAAKCM